MMYKNNKTAPLILSLLLMFFSYSSQALISGTAESTVVVNNSWGSGYCAEVSVANNGDANITDWTVTLELNDSVINNLWNGRLSGTTVGSVGYNATITPAGSSVFGFCANIIGSNFTPEVIALTVEGGGSSSSSSSTSSTSSSTGSSSSSSGSTSSTSSSSTSSSSTSSSTSSTSSSSTSSSTSSSGGIVEGCSGYATRFWDCCKPHCGWSGNVPVGVDAINSCSVSNQLITDLSTKSSCEGGDAHTCYGLSPFKVSDTLSYGYAATSNGDVCGRCYQLQFTGESYNAPGDPGSSALLGKTMIVQAINIGFDVGGGQFDILVPGGGVGAFNACSDQWGVSNDELGAQYGGLLTACKQELGYSASLSEYKGCLTNRCDSVFGSRGLTSLQEGCLWYADWFEAADNPALKYKEVACPSELSDASGMDRSFLDDISTACGD